MRKSYSKTIQDPIGQSPLVLFTVGYGGNNKRVLQISKFPLVLHQKALVTQPIHKHILCM